MRIVRDTHDEGEDEPKSKKMKKAHRGYAFVVYEREKDMKSIVPLLMRESLSRKCLKHLPHPLFHFTLISR